MTPLCEERESGSEREAETARIKRQHSEASIYLMTQRFLAIPLGKKKVLPVLTFKMTAVLKSHYQRTVN